MTNVASELLATQEKRNDRMKDLAAKIAELASKDTKMEIFGANTYGHGHQYRLNPVLPLDAIVAFEHAYDVRLPQDYVDFVTQIGNGGIGPYYGLYSLEQAVKDIPVATRRGFLASPFPHTSHFNPVDDAGNELVDDVFDDRHIYGSIILSHQGCGYYDRLVVTGPQAGQVWTDGRVSDQGIGPLGCDYFAWYDRWLTDAIGELETRKDS